MDNGKAKPKPKNTKNSSSKDKQQEAQTEARRPRSGLYQYLKCLDTCYLLFILLHRKSCYWLNYFSNKL